MHITAILIMKYLIKGSAEFFIKIKKKIPLVFSLFFLSIFHLLQKIPSISSSALRIILYILIWSNRFLCKRVIQKEMIYIKLDNSLFLLERPTSRNVFL